MSSLASTTTSSSAATSSISSNSNSSSTNNAMSSSAVFWIPIWMLNSVGVTLLNKAAFASFDFQYPYLLSAMHMLCNAAGAQYLFWTSANEKSFATQLLGQLTRKTLDTDGQRFIWLFSLLFSANIAIGNVSLKYVSVNFNQVMRSLAPAVTIALGYLWLGKAVSSRRLWAVVPVVVGVALACFGDMSYTAIGFFYTILCVVLGALKVVASGEFMTRASLKMHPVDLLGHMAPLACVQCSIMAVLTGEFRDAAGRWDTELSPTVNPWPLAVVFVSGVAAFCLNICSLQTNKVTSPLTLCIAANVKQVLMIVMSTVLFHVHVSFLNGLGILIVLAGSAKYSYVSVMEQQQQKLQAANKASETEGKEEDDNDDKLEIATMHTSVSSTSSSSDEGSEVNVDDLTDHDEDDDDDEHDVEQAALIPKN